MVFIAADGPGSSSGPCDVVARVYVVRRERLCALRQQPSAAEKLEEQGRHEETGVCKLTFASDEILRLH